VGGTRTRQPPGSDKPEMGEAAVRFFGGHGSRPSGGEQRRRRNVKPPGSTARWCEKRRRGSRRVSFDSQLLNIHSFFLSHTSICEGEAYVLRAERTAHCFSGGFPLYLLPFVWTTRRGAVGCGVEDMK